VRSVNGIVVDGESADSSKITRNKDISANNEYVLNDGTIVETPEDRDIDILDIDLKLEGLTGQTHNITIDIDFGMNVGILASTSQSFKYNRTFWINNMLDIDIISPIQSSNTLNRIQFEYKITSFQINLDGYIEVHIYYYPDDRGSGSGDVDTKEPFGRRMMRSSQVLQHPAGVLHINGLDVGVNRIEMVLYKNNNKKKKKKKKRAYKGKRKSVTWTVLDDKKAIEIRNDHNQLIGKHVPGVWENSHLSTILWTIARNDDNMPNSDLLIKINSFVKKYGLNTLLKIRASDGKSALHWSYEYSNLYFQKWLIKNNFNIHCKDRHNKKPIEYNYNHYAAPIMSKDTLNMIVQRVKEKNILLAADGYIQGQTGWYVNRKGGLLWYDVVDGQWIRINERQPSGKWVRNWQNVDKKRRKKKKKKKKGD
jgi:hypothetical protein